MLLTAALTSAVLAAASGRAAEDLGLGSERIDPSGPFRIEADELSYEPDRNLYEAIGNVRLVQQAGGTLTADWVTYNLETQIAVAAGNVVIQDAGDTLRAEFAAVDLSTMVALATDASLDSDAPAFIVEGQQIRKTGLNTHHIEDGTFTTCRCPKEPNHGGPGHCRPWEIDAGESDIRIGGYAVMRDVQFKLKGFPFAYLPWLILPVKTERQSGFLFPGQSSSNRSGAAFELPFFWALRDNVNVLLRPGWISERGAKYGVETEYVFGERAEGAAGVAIIPSDDDVEDSQRTPFSDSRWRYWLDHYQPLSPATQFGIHLNEISDNNYVVDFTDLPFETRHARFLESTLWLSSGKQWVYGDLEAAYLDDIQSPENLDRDDFLLHRLPDVHLSSLPRALGSLPLLAGVDLRYTYFHQRADRRTLDGFTPVGGLFFDTGPDGLFDPQEPSAGGIFTGADNSGDNLTTQGDGLFSAGELKADDGHRIDLYPRLSLPRRFGPVEMLGEVGFRETLYNPSRATSERREIWTARVDVRTRLQRSGTLFGTAVQHVLEPSLKFARVSTPRQRGNPLFIPRDSIRPERLISHDIRVTTRDPSDRVRAERLLLFAVENRLYARGDEEHGSTRQVARARLGGGYDFQSSKMDILFLEGSLDPGRVPSVSFLLGIDPTVVHVTEAAASTSWRHDRGHDFTVGYRFLRGIPDTFANFPVSDDVFQTFASDFDRVTQLNAGGRFVISPRWEVFGDGILALQESRTAFGFFGLLFQSRCRCWQLASTIRYNSRPRETRVELTVHLTGLGRQIGKTVDRTYVPLKHDD